MKPTTTRTLNRLPFGELEPHRFEDLVRQLAYDLRRWKSLEATGRSGSDAGADIRAVELVSLSEEPGDEDEAEEVFAERNWIFQCKREKALSPKAVRKAVQESLGSVGPAPHGFVLAAACDISVAARDAFRQEMVSRRIEEFFIWAKGELEDLLFQPKNDRLLFAYFGIALQPRRRGYAASLRSEITRKKQLTALIGEEGERDGKLVLLRDPTDERYPNRPRKGDPPARWFLCRALTLRKPGHLMVLRHEYLAAISTDRKKWDAVVDFDVLLHMAEGELQSAHAWDREDRDVRDRSPFQFWNEYIEESQRAHLKELRAVPLERILALDPLGDGFFPIPHILVEFVGDTGPFAGGIYSHMEPVGLMRGRIDLDIDESNRTQIFPRPLPDEAGPEPAGFDDTGKGMPLTATGEAKLDNLLGKMNSEPGAQATSAHPASDEAVGKLRKEFDEFRAWRQSIAVPVFSSFVLRLRKEGHRAGVIVRSVAPDDEMPGHGALESVELKIRLTGNNYYYRAGSVRIQPRQFNGVWQTEISPSAEENRRSYQAQGVVMHADKTTIKEQLETIVLEMLQRLLPK